MSNCSLLISGEGLSLLNGGLQKQVDRIIRLCPQSEQVFQEVIKYVTRKKTAAVERVATGEDPLLILYSLNVLVPRKKLDLCITNTSIALYQNYKMEGSQSTTLEVPMEQFALCDLFYTCLLPTPNKNKLSFTLVLFFRSQEQTSSIAFSFDDESKLTRWHGSLITEKCQSVSKVLSTIIPAIFNKAATPIPQSALVIHSPNETIFRSAKSTPLEPIFYLNCHIRVKDSFLYFLDDAVVCGFSKPIMIFPLAEIAHMGLTSGLTGRFYDLQIEMKSHQDGEGPKNTKKKDDGQPSFIDFETIEQSEHDNVCAYIKYCMRFVKLASRAQTDPQQAAINPDDLFDDSDDGDFHANTGDEGASDATSDASSETVDSESVDLEQDEEEVDDEDDGENEQEKTETENRKSEPEKNDDQSMQTETSTSSSKNKEESLQVDASSSVLSETDAPTNYLSSPRKRLSAMTAQLAAIEHERRKRLFRDESEPDLRSTKKVHAEVTILDDSDDSDDVVIVAPPSGRDTNNDADLSDGDVSLDDSDD